MIVFAILTVVKATVVCGAAFCLSRLCRHARASIRHLLFVLAFAALLVIPASGLFLPMIAVPVPVGTALARQAQDGAALARLSTGTAIPASTTPVPPRHTPERSTRIVQAVAALWFVGLSLFLMPVVAGFWQLRRLRQRALPWANGQAIAQRLAPALVVHRRVDLRLHDTVMGPMTCGVLKPSIILPANAQQWDKLSLTCSVRHELEHVARRDFLTHCLSRIVCAAYWFHPLVWAAWRQLRLEAERACDDAVLQECDARDYAALLVSIAQAERGVTRQPLLAMAGGDDLAARVTAVLDDGRARGRVGRRWATVMIVIGAFVMGSVAPITVVRARPQTVVTTSAAPLLRFETAHLERNQGIGTSLIMITDRDGLAGVGPDGRVRWLTAINQTARGLLWYAYGPELRVDIYGVVGLHQIVNTPEWADSDRFDVLAKTPSRATPEDIQEMMRSLLAERFKLVAHRESREFPLYALVRARADGSLGTRMTPSQIDCTAGPGASSPCGLSGGRGHLVGRGITMAQLIKILPNHLIGGSHIGLDRRLIDRTGLDGRFDFTLEWIPDPVGREIRAPSQAPPQLAGYRSFAFPLELNAPNFLAALPEQLGLKFDSQLAPEPVLVIDSIEPPDI